MGNTKHIMCQMKMRWIIGMCTTCCCAKGLLDVRIASSLDRMLTDKGGRDLHDCKTWYNIQDAAIRAIIGYAKGFDAVGTLLYKQQCFHSKGDKAPAEMRIGNRIDVSEIGE